MLSSWDGYNKTAPKIDEPSPYKMIRTTNIRNGQISLDSVKYVTEEVYRQWTRRQVPKPGDVLLTREAPMGEVGMLLTDDHVFLGQRIVSYRTDPKKLYNKFLLYAFQSKDLQDQIQSFASGSTVQHMRVPDTKALTIPLPPIAQQKQIVAILDEAFEGIDSAIANTEKNLANARELFESYLNAIFTRKGDDWVDVTLGEIATFRNGLNFTKNSKGESIKIVGVKDFQNNFWIDEEQLETVTVDGDLKEIDVLREGDILTVRSNGNKELIGRCVLAGELSEKTSHSGFTIRIRIERQDIYLPFAVHFLKSRTLRRMLIESGDGISISSLNQQKLSLIELSFPPLEKQKSLVTVVDELSDASQRLEAIYQQKLAALNELKQSILQKAFSGELTAEVGDVAVEKVRAMDAA